MSKYNPHRNILAAGILLALSVGVNAPAAAQQQSASPQEGQKDADQLDTVVVKGVRASLIRAVDSKRDASLVQDSINAVELGQFPDDNVADSLSHITGVSIKRKAGGEGQKVSIRGLGPEYTMTTFNGRILGTDGAGRDFAFDVLPADVISGADVIKSTQAQLTEGAIGGLINLRSASPFDQKGMHGVVRLEGDRNFMSHNNGGKLSATYSQTFANDTMGVLLGMVYAKRTDRTDNAGNDGGWSRNADPNDPSWMWGNTWGGAIDPNNNGELDPNEYGLIGPGQFRVGSIIEDKKRMALSGKFEWRPSNNFRVIVDGIKTKLDAPQVGYQQSFYSLYAPGRWSNMTIQNGIVTDFTMDNPDPEQRLNPELLNMTSHRVVDTSMVGVNAEWTVNDRFKMTGDLYQSKSSRESGGLDTYVVLRMNQPNVSRIRLVGAAVPQVTTTFADGRDLVSGLASGKFGASDFNTHYLSLAGDNINDDIRGGSLDGQLFVDRFKIDRVRFGINYTDRNKSRDLVNNALTGGENYYSGSNAINVGNLGGNVVSHAFSLPNYMTDVNSQFPRSFLAFDVPGYLSALRAYNGKPRPDGGVYDYAKAAPVWNPLESYRVAEKTTAGYVQVDFAGERWNADVGVRFGKTRTNATAWEAKINSITSFGPWNYSAQYAAPTVVQQETTYNFVLPSANFTYRMTDDLQLRLGAAKTMARPPVSKLAPTSTTASVAWGEFTQIYGGNVDLKPYEASQGDVSLEWYFSKRSIFNVALFLKRITNQLTTSWEPGKDIGVGPIVDENGAPILDGNGNPVTGPTLFNVMRPINGDYAKVRGLEVGLQHFWENGFGVRGQYTRNWAKSWVGGEKRPLEGIAPATSSLGVMYEKNGWSLSATADHTDGFVTAVNVIGAGFNEQVEPITWLTAQVAYYLNDHISFSVEGRNLLDSTERYTLNGNPMLQQGYYRYGRGITLGMSIKF